MQPFKTMMTFILLTFSVSTLAEGPKVSVAAAAGFAAEHGTTVLTNPNYANIESGDILAIFYNFNDCLFMVDSLVAKGVDMSNLACIKVER